ncbi:MAG TPA: hypothetical protein VIL34_16455 [Actinopolymorphaceae bacterium]
MSSSAAGRPSQGSRSRGSVGCLIFLVGALVVAGGLGYAGWTWITKPRPSQESLEDHPGDICGTPRRYFPDQPAYDGSGPHPVVVVLENPESHGKFRWRKQLLMPSNPTQRMPAYLNPRDDSTVQLVACLSRTEEGRQVKTCDFSGKTNVPMYEASYEATVYEARTGKEVGTATIPQAVDAGCPAAVLYREGDEPKVYTKPSFTQVRDALAEFTGAG